jgi:DNA primase large subunit
LREPEPTSFLSEIRARAFEVEERVAKTTVPPYDKVERDLIAHYRGTDLASCMSGPNLCSICQWMRQAPDKEYVCGCCAVIQQALHTALRLHRGRP